MSERERSHPALGAQPLPRTGMYGATGLREVGHFESRQQPSRRAQVIGCVAQSMHQSIAMRIVGVRPQAGGQQVEAAGQRIGSGGKMDVVVLRPRGNLQGIKLVAGG